MRATVDAHRELDIDDDLEFQRREWRVQRAGTILLLAFVLAALLGFTGMGGLFARAAATSPDHTLHVEYDRVVRRSGVSELTIRVRGGGPVALSLPDTYLQRWRVEDISPEPDRQSTQAGRLIFTIDNAPPEATIRLRLECQTAGILQSDIALAGGPTIHIRQWALF